VRIIAGSARGRALLAPKGQSTRPTQDYVRESLFNIIQRDVPGAVVLDLFAGSGALALEALSRGAEHAVLADKARQAADCIRRNLRTLGFAGQAVCVQADWRKTLKQTFVRPFDLVFLDPPYDLTLYREIADMLAEQALLADRALIVVEHHRDSAFTLSPAFVLTDQRTYGDTAIHFYRFQAGGMTDET
jgi:16S rRNA (guanine966-N2)-methyltransferase